MILLLIRHAQAADQDDARYPDDSLRPLVGRGRRTQRQVSRWLVKQGWVPTAVLSSPWKRAWQTAGILAEEVGLGKKARLECGALAEAPRLDAIAQAVGPRGSDDIVALVGHEPWIGELGSLILTGSPTRLSIEFRKSAVLAIELTTLGPASGRLLFMRI